MTLFCADCGHFWPTWEPAYQTHYAECRELQRLQGEHVMRELAIAREFVCTFCGYDRLFEHPDMALLICFGCGNRVTYEMIMDQFHPTVVT